MVTHEDIDRRSIALHEAVAEKIKRNPSLLEVARGNIARFLDSSSRSRPYLEEWQEILNLPQDELFRAMLCDSERMRALRQSSPFAGILTPQERWKIYETFRA